MIGLAEGGFIGFRERNLNIELLDHKGGDNDHESDKHPKNAPNKISRIISGKNNLPKQFKHERPKGIHQHGIQPQKHDNVLLIRIFLPKAKDEIKEPPTDQEQPNQNADFHQGNGSGAGQQ
jgi:hypothetical protein